MSQPDWKLIANLGDVNPIDYGGYFVYEDTTDVYPPEAELLVSPDDDDSGEGWTVYRFCLDRCTLTPDANGELILSDNSFHPDYPAWFAEPESRRRERPQDTCYLSNVAELMGQTLEQLQADFCADDPRVRAQAYLSVGSYHGFENFDSYPLTFKKRADVEARYAAELSA